jgi:hypothetical protein
MTSIYVASKTVHAPRWRFLRARGVPIVSTWIDEAGQGETLDMADLWSRNLAEAAGASACIVYSEPGETMKGAIGEALVAAFLGVPVYAVGVEAHHTWLHHPGILVTGAVELAVFRAMNPHAYRTPAIFPPFMRWPSPEEAAGTPSEYRQGTGKTTRAARVRDAFRYARGFLPPMDLENHE